MHRDLAIKDLGKFDLITAFEVFEHVPDVWALLSNLDTLMAPNGLILFSTLLSEGNIRPNEKPTWWYASPRNGHISLFTSKSLARLAGSRSLEFGSFSSGFHVFHRQVPHWATHLASLA